MAEAESKGTDGSAGGLTVGVSNGAAGTPRSGSATPSGRGRQLTRMGSSKTPHALGAGAGAAAGADALEGTAEFIPKGEAGVLHYGDVFYLQTAEQLSGGSGFLVGEGMSGRVGAAIAVDHVPEDFRACLFKVTPMLGYDALRALSKVGVPGGVQGRHESMDFMRSYYEEKAKREEQANQAQIAEVFGMEHPVTYGKIVQLQHEPTGKYLTMVPRTIAEMDKECLKLELTDGGQESWFQINPRFKVRSEGGRVYFGDQIQFVNIKLADHYLSPSRMAYPDNTSEAASGDLLGLGDAGMGTGMSASAASLAMSPTAAALADDEDAISGDIRINEVNLSSKVSMGWRLGYYQSAATDDHPVLTVNRAVRMFHPEADGYLCASANYSKRQPYLSRTDETEQSEEGLSSKYLWRFEKAQRSIGGNMQWGQPYRLRHVPTGRYLAVGGVEGDPTQDDIDDRGVSFKVELLTEVDIARENARLPEGSEPAEARTYFYIVPVEATETNDVYVEDLRLRLQHFLPNGGAIVAGNTVRSCWLHNTHERKRGKGEKGGEKLLASLRLNFNSMQTDADSLTVSVISSAAAHEIDVMLQLIPVAEDYMVALKAATASGAPLRREDARAFISALKVATDLCTDPVTLKPIVPRQRLLRELKIIDVCFWVLCFPRDKPTGTAENIGIARLATAPAFAAALEVHKACFALVTAAFRNNRGNEMHVASGETCVNPISKRPDFLLPRGPPKKPHTGEAPTMRPWLKEIIGQLGNGVGSAAILSALVDNNRKLLNEKIDESTIPIFVGLIGAQGPHAKFMRFFKALCSCEGSQIITNQELMLRLVCSAVPNESADKNRYGLLIETALDMTGSRRARRSLSDEAHAEKHGGARPDHGQYLAAEYDHEGLADVVIMWSNDDNWSIGMESLFHSPKALGLKSRALPKLLSGKHGGALGDYRRRIKKDTEPCAWVRLADIAWVLDPAFFYAKAHPGAKGWKDYARSMESDAAEKARFNNCKQLVEYYIAELELFAEMCLDRSYNCIEYLEKQFSYELLVTAIVSDLYPDAIRTAFTTLCTRLYVDRWPHEPLGLPKLIRVYERIADVSHKDKDTLPQFRLPEGSPLLEEGVEPHMSFPDANKFHILEDYISDHFTELDGKQVITDDAGTAFTLSLLELLRNLVRYGFYGTHEEMVDLATPLIATMDGRADSMEGERRGTQKRKARKATRQSITGGLSMLTHNPLAGAIGGGVTALGAGLSAVGGAVGGAVGLTHASDEGGTTAISGSERYHANAQTLVVMDSKRNMCEVLNYFTDIRTDFRLSRLLHQVRQAFNHSSSRSKQLYRARDPEHHPEDEELDSDSDDEVKHGKFILTAPGLKVLHDQFTGEEGTAFDLDKMSDGTALDDVLRDLLMYENADLVNSALDLLFRRYDQKAVLMDCLQEVQLLVRPAAVEAYDMLARELSNLRNSVESYETWGMANEFSPIDGTVVKQVQDTLVKIRKLCSEGDFEDSAIANEEHQELLRNLDTHHIILRALQIPEDGSGHLAKIKGLCHRFLVQFLRDNEQNQVLLAPQVDFFVDLMTASASAAAPASGGAGGEGGESGVGGGGASRRMDNPLWGDGDALSSLTAIFEGNRPLCESVPPGLVWRLGRWLDEGGGRPTPVFEFFQHIISPGDGQVVAQNQNLCLDVVTSTQFSNVLRLFTEGFGGDTGAGPMRSPRHATLVPGAIAEEEVPIPRTAGFQQRIKLGKMARKGMPLPPELEAHVRLIELFSFVSKAGNVSCEAKCQVLMPLDYTLEVCLHKDTHPAVQTAFLKYIADAYFDTELIVSGLTTNPRVWDLIESFGQRVYAFVLDLGKGAKRRRASSVKGMAGGGASPAVKVATEDNEASNNLFEGVLFALELFFTKAYKLKAPKPVKIKQVTLSSGAAAPAGGAGGEDGEGEGDGDDDGSDGEGGEVKEDTREEKIIKKLKREIAGLMHFPNLMNEDQKRRVRHCARALNVKLPFAMNAAPKPEEGAEEEDDGLPKAAGAGAAAGGGGAGKAMLVMPKERRMFEEFAEAVKATPAFRREIADDTLALAKLIRYAGEKEIDFEAMGGPAPSGDGAEGGKDSKDGKGGKGKAAAASAAAQAKPVDENAVTFTKLGPRLVDHVREVVTSRRLDERSPELPLLVKVLQVFATMIEKGCKFVQLTEAEKDDIPEHKLEAMEQDFLKLQNRLDTYGLSVLCVDIMANHRAPDSLVVQAMETLSWVLLEGNAQVQRTIHKHLTGDAQRSKDFFSACRKRMRRAAEYEKARRKAWRVANELAALKRREDSTLAEAMRDGAQEDIAVEDTEDPSIGVDKLFRVLQLFCEGHNLSMQNLLRSQPEARQSFDLLAEAVDFTATVAKNEVVLAGVPPTVMEVLAKAFDFLIEMLQGPCLGNQMAAAQSALVDVCKRTMWTKFRHPDVRNDVDAVKEVKAGATKALISMLEGRNDTAVHYLLLQKLEVPLVRRRLVEIRKEYLKEKDLPENKANPEWMEEFLGEGFDLLTLTNALGAHDERVAKEMAPNVPAKPIKPAEEAGKAEWAEYNKREKEYSDKHEYAQAYKLIDDMIRNVEVDWKGKLERVYFPVPSECQFLAKDTKTRLLTTIDLSTPDAKATEFVEACKEVMDEMLLIEKLDQYWIYRKVGRHLLELKHASFVLGLIMNFVLVISLSAVQPAGRDAETPWWEGTGGDAALPTIEPSGMNVVMRIAGFLQLSFSIIILIFQAANRAPLIFRGHLQNMEKRLRVSWLDLVLHFQPVFMTGVGFVLLGAILALRYTDDFISRSGLFFIFMIAAGGAVFLKSLRSLWRIPVRNFPLSLPYCAFYDILTDDLLVFYFFYVVFALLGILVLPYFYAFHLYDLIVMSETLKNVVRAVIVPIKKLAMTGVLALFVFYTFALIAFYYFRPHFADEDTGVNRCATMLFCFLATVDFGLQDTISGAMIGQSSDSPQWGGRLVFELSFVIIVTIALLNIVFGLIIDTFSALREQQEEREDQIENNCFICNIPRSTFDSDATKKGHSRGFETHIHPTRGHHNMWNYLFFIVFIEHKKESEYNGLEQYVADAIKAEDTRWIPNGRAMVLGTGTEDDGDAIEAVDGRVQDLARSTARSSADLKRRVAELREANQRLQSQITDLQRSSDAANDTIMTALAGLKQ